MKIAFYMTTVLEHSGGFEKYLIETAAHLAEQPDISVDIITMDNAFTDRITSLRSVFYMRRIDKKLNYKEPLSDIKKRLGKASYYKAHTFRDLRHKLNDYDVIYSKNELIEAFLMKFFIGYRHIPPVIFGGHTPLEYPNPASFHPRLHNFLYGSFIYRFLASGVTRFHAINTHEKSLYAKQFGENKVVKVYNPFDITAFQNQADQHRAPYDFDQNRTNILWVGRLTEQKGIYDLVQIIPEVNHKLGKSAGQIQWNIVGDGDLRTKVEGLAQDVANVRYLGHTDQKYMADTYRQQQLLLSTSKWEGYPYTLIEPQAFGLQVFAYDIPGPADILPEYSGGHLASDQDQLIAQLTETLRQYTAASAQIPKAPASTQFKPDRIYKQLVAMLSLQTP